MSIYSSLLTTTGAAQYAYNEANGLPTVLSQVVLGDNNGNFFTPSINDGAINNQVYVASINSITVDPLDSTIDNVEIVLPYNVGGWTIREFRIKDSNGTVMYTGNCEIAKTILSSGQAIETQIIFPIKRVNTSAVTLNFDSSNLATFQYVTNAITTHNNDPNAHGAAAWATKVGVQNQQYSYAVASGTTTAYTAAFNPAITALTAGMKLVLNTNAIGTNTNTAPTLAVNGLTSKTIKRQNGAALLVGDLPPIAELTYNGTNFVLLNPALQGALLNTVTITNTGANNYTPTTGARLFKVTLVGGGAAGGGTPVTTGVQASAGGGGGAGAVRIAWLTKSQLDALGYPIVVTIGAGGTGVVGASGNAGGTSSFGSLMTCNGGSSLSTVGTAVTGVNVSSSHGGNGSSSGAGVNQGGVVPTTGKVFTLTALLTGAGGSNALGMGGQEFNNAAAGVAGSGYGGGGSGAGAYTSAVALAGGAGANGVCIIEEYA